MSKTLELSDKIKSSPKGHRTVNVVHLSWKTGKSGRLMIVPKDNDRFMVQVRYAVEILQKSKDFERFHDQFKVLLDILVAWIRSRSDVKNAYVTLREGSLSFVVVKASAKYDAKYEDELSDLDIEIANDEDLDLITLTVLSLPPASDESLTTFLDSRFTLEICADGKRKKPHQAGKR